MDAQVQAALITAIASVIIAGAGWSLRRKSKSAVLIRRSLNRQEALEGYVFVLRRQVNAAGRRPHPWPEALRYLNRDDQDVEGNSDE